MYCWEFWYSGVFGPILWAFVRELSYYDECGRLFIVCLQARHFDQSCIACARNRNLIELTRQIRRFHYMKIDQNFR